MSRQLQASLPFVQPRIASLDELGALVRNRRLKQQLRIDDAASFCGVSANLLSRLENGRPVQTDKLLLVLAGLGLSMILWPKAAVAEIALPDVPPESA